jgi:hypothetical protein
LYFDFEKKLLEKKGDKGLSLGSGIFRLADGYEQAMMMNPFLFRNSNEAFLREKLAGIKKDFKTALDEADDLGDYVIPQEMSSVKKAASGLGLSLKEDRNADGWRKL